MGFGEALINITIARQSLYEMPWIYCTTSERFKLNPKLGPKGNRFWKTPALHFTTFVGVLVFLYCLYYLRYLFNLYQFESKFSMEQVLVYLFVTPLILLVLVNSHLIGICPSTNFGILQAVVDLSGVGRAGLPKSN